MIGNFDKTAPVGAAAIPQYSAVKLVGGLLVVCTAATDDCVGFMVDSVEANAEIGTYRKFGQVKVIAGAAYADEVDLMLTTAGQVIAHDGVSTKKIVGRSIEAATAQGDEMNAIVGLAGFSAGPAA